MEFILELIFEIIVEGSLEIGTSKRVPLPLRIFTMLIVIAVFGGVIVLFFILALSIMKSNPALAWLLIVFDVFLAICCIYGFRKKWREKHNSLDE